MNKKACLIPILTAMVAACSGSLAPAEPDPVPAVYSLGFEAGKPRILVAGSEIDLVVRNSGPVAEDLTVSLTVPENDGEYLNLFNTKYDAVAKAAPQSIWSCESAVMKKGESTVTLTLKADLARIKAENSSAAFVLPVTLSTDGNIASHDVRYLVFPTYTTSDAGHPVVHLTHKDAWMEVWHADGDNDKACVFCPGGGYSSLSGQGTTTEPGVFEGHGMTCAYLHYTLPLDPIRGRYDLPTQDAEDAVDILRANASQWGGYTKVGTCGRSAGGHLAGATAAYHKDKVDFQILLYPVISMDISRSHEGSCYQFLGDTRPQYLVDAWSLDKLVTKDTPRAFVYYALDDTVVPQRYNGEAFCKAMKEAGAECHEERWMTGGHATPASVNYPNAMLEWIKTF